MEQLDSAAAAIVAPRPVIMPALPSAGGSSRTLVAAGHAPLDFGSGSAAAVSRTQASLAQIQARALEQVRRRLAREADHLTSRFAAARQAQVSAGIEQARQEAIDKYDASLASLLAPVAEQRINLHVQIAALKIDARPSNPPTAPNDYWNKLLANRQAALDALPLPQTIALRAALDQINAQVDTARHALQQAADAQTAVYRAQLEGRNRDILLRQSAGFTREQNELMVIAGQLDEQLSRPLQNSTIAQPSSGSGSIARQENHDADGSRQRLSIAIASQNFAAERQRLIAQLSDSTRRSAAHAAAQLNYDIVDWNAAHPDMSATDLIVSRMRANAPHGI